MINDIIPEIPSQLSQNKLLPERSDSIKTNISFQEYIPVGCFCDRSKCKANVKSIESPILGLYTRDGKTVTSLDIEVNEGELMYIILIDRKSSLSDDTYLERTSYWYLADGQHQLLAGASFDFEARRQVSVTEMRDNNLKYSIGLETKQIVVASLEMTTGLSILSAEELENKNSYHYSASQLSRVVGIYQLFHELAIYPGISLTNYVGTQQTGARCVSYLIFKQKCGFLQLLPSFLQRTPSFSQVAVNLVTTDNTMFSSNTSDETLDVLTTIPGSYQKSNTKGLSREAKVTLISLSSVVVVLAAFVAGIWFFYKRCYQRSQLRPVRLSLLPEDSDDLQNW
jgi:hypothetical protein